MSSGIYKITNMVNGKLYIGSAFNLNQRKSEHFSKLRKNNHTNIHLQRSFNKHGADNFVFTVIEYVEDKNNILNREQFWIDYFGIENIYNICATAGNTAGLKQTKESIKKRVEKVIGTKRSEETKLKISLSKIGKKRGAMDDLHKSKIKDSSPLKVKIICLDTNTIYDSISEASRHIGCKPASIVNLLKGRQKTVFGLHFMTLDDYNNSSEIDIKNIINFSMKRRIRCIEDDIIFDSITEASKAYNIERRCINQCCSGRTKTCGGYHWEYVED